MINKSATFFIVLAMTAAAANAQRVEKDDMSGLTFQLQTPRVQFAGGERPEFKIDGYMQAGSLGAPALPMRSEYIEVPFCDRIEVQVTDAVYDTVALPGILSPMQPSASKNPRVGRSVEADAAAYGFDGFYGHPLVEVESLGLLRDRRLATVRIWPISVSHKQAKAVICRSATVSIKYVGVDSTLTANHYQRFHTSAFTPVKAMNRLYAQQWSLLARYDPVRYTIVLPSQFRCKAVDDFVAFKRMQGMIVDTMVVDNGASPEAVAARLSEAFFTNSPATTYVLLVGDHEQLPAFMCQLPSNNQMHSNMYELDDHITDHYFSTFTDDNLPDCYVGRMPAKNVAQLTNMIEKTLYYEQYQFEDDSYLGRAVLVAGMDQGYQSDYYDNAYRCADPTMDYLAVHYVNADNGFKDVTYYKNNYKKAPEGVTVTGSSNDGTVRDALIALYNKGAGWVNYSAHGDWNEWSIPRFTVSNILGDTVRYWTQTQIVPAMSNVGKPSFMIGNCCLSSHFDSETCFGEALLRRTENAGAVAYIGATNSTFWDEDFYWAVGLRESVENAMSLDYVEDGRGAYDHLFHTHGELIYGQAYTAGQMLLSGVLSVVGTGSASLWTQSVNDYYWEIYELFGDPSLMPWLGRAADLPTPKVMFKPNEHQLLVSTMPGAYVAMIDLSTMELKSAAFAYDDGYAYLDMPSGFDADSLAALPSTCMLSVSAQGYKHSLVALPGIEVGVHDAVSVQASVRPNPASGSVTVEASGLRHVTLLGQMGQTLREFDATADCVRLPLDGLRPGVYMLRLSTSAGVTVRKLMVY